MNRRISPAIIFVWLGALLWTSQARARVVVSIRRALGVLISAAGILVLGGLASGDTVGGNLLWEDIFQVNVINSISFVETEGKRVFAAGITDTDDPVNVPYFIVRAHNAKTGTLVWETALGSFNELLAAFAVEEGRVFAAGSQGPLFGCHACLFSLIVRAYDAATGRVLWEDGLGTCFNQPDCRPSDQAEALSATGLAADKGRVFVGGSHYAFSSGSSTALLRAYDAATGNLLWENNRPAESPLFLGSRGGRVFAVTTVYDSTNHPLTLPLRAYDASSGEQFWEVTLPNGTSVFAVGPNKVFVAGSGFIRAYNAATGELLWNTSSASPRQLAVGRERLFAVGDTISAYDASTGDLLWADDRSSNLVTVHGAHVFAASGFLVRAYDADNGAFLWENYQATAMPATANAVTAGGGRVFVGGEQSRRPRHSEWILRAYDIK